MWKIVIKMYIKSSLIEYFHTIYLCSSRKATEKRRKVTGEEER